MLYTGNRMDVLLLPGYACTSEIWRPVCGALAARHAVTLVDWPRAHTPSFHSLGSFAAWLGCCYDVDRFGCIVGHSLGGLAALEWLSASGRTPAHLVLMETFLLPPPPFFRNVLLEEKKPAGRGIQKMLSDEKLYYSPVLAERLRWIDMTRHVARIGSHVHALYGDRGCGKPAEVAAELRWPEGLSGCIDLHVITNACHFPMVENPAATADVLLGILG